MLVEFGPQSTLTLGQKGPKEGWRSRVYTWGLGLQGNSTVPRKRAPMAHICHDLLCRVIAYIIGGVCRQWGFWRYLRFREGEVEPFSQSCDCTGAGLETRAPAALHHFYQQNHLISMLPTSQEPLYTQHLQHRDFVSVLLVCGAKQGLCLFWEGL